MPHDLWSNVAFNVAWDLVKYLLKGAFIASPALLALVAMMRRKASQWFQDRRDVIYLWLGSSATIGFALFLLGAPSPPRPHFLAEFSIAYGGTTDISETGAHVLIIATLTNAGEVPSIVRG